MPRGKWEPPPYIPPVLVLPPPLSALRVNLFPPFVSMDGQSIPEFVLRHKQVFGQEASGSRLPTSRPSWYFLFLCIPASMWRFLDQNTEISSTEGLRFEEKQKKPGCRVASGSRLPTSRPSWYSRIPLSISHHLPTQALVDTISMCRSCTRSPGLHI